MPVARQLPSNGADTVAAHTTAPARPCFT